MNEGIQFSGVLRGQVRFNIQVLDATADSCVVSGGIKTVDSGNAAATGTNAVQDESTSLPSGESIPMPVITTRRLAIPLHLSSLLIMDWNSCQ